MLARAEEAPEHGTMATAISVLWSQVLKFDAADPHWPDRDRCLLSAGFGAPWQGMEVEASAASPGQGLAMAVGMALAERMLAARFGRSLVDHRTWVIASEDDLMEGSSHEAASLAGHLRLEKMTVLAADRETLPAGSHDQAKRFAAYGWAVQRVDLQDATALAHALSFALRSKRPTLIACRGSAFEAPLTAPTDTAEEIGSRGAGARRAWLKRSAHHPQRAEFERVVAGRLPESWHAAMAALKTGLGDSRFRLATEEASRHILEALAPAVAELVGGSTDAEQVRGMAGIAPGQYGGRHIQYGSRRHGMALAMNGMALHGGMIAFGGGDIADPVHPALLLAARLRLRVIHVLTGPGEVEPLAGLRAIANLHVFHPADPIETAECWELALRRAEGPSVIALCSQKLPAHRSELAENRCARGGYVLADVEGARQVTLIAAGAEVSLAMAARRALAGEGIAAAVVSLPCWESFAQQDQAYRSRVLGGAPRIGIEASGGFGWERWLGEGGSFLGLEDFTAEAMADAPYRHFGLTTDALVNAVKRRIDIF